ncbi:ABC transporter permease [Terrimonas sp. NA20]|uniref:ABC transporter permease n=1 Tax=Terrimonas ginsenosidimutans TaxID=2908004 RepID=A0ABS9KXI0_9BACT|nr:ABC transporter permease [Terrimonas ginsenosidimutans]MCG2617084.1 ABC transporter permease [Terrimonas ginsenosidimutans]
MFRTNLKIAWRNLLKDKQFALINVFGLATGLTCAILIFLWIDDELKYDKFFNSDERLYQLMEFKAGDESTASAQSSGLLADAVAKQVRGVDYAAAVAPPDWFPQYTLSADEKNIKATGQYAGKDYFNIFSFKLIEGNKSQVLENKNSIVISDELAQKLFGQTTNVTGRPVRFDQDTTFFVSGVFEKVPAQSSQQFDFVLPFDYFKSIKEWVNLWDHSGPLCYVLLNRNTDIQIFNRNVADIITRSTGNASRKVLATRFSDAYLYGLNSGKAGDSGKIGYVKLFSLLALFILSVACINFMNLSTAKASRRLKEIGIKKVVGARRPQLIFQFLTESLLLTLLAAAFALFFVSLLIPAFNQITGKQISFHLTPDLLLSFILIIVATGLLAGCYPALYLSKFNPLNVLKGKIGSSVGEVLSRKGLVVFQFTLSTVLIVAVMVIYQQIQFIQSKDTGYNKNNIVRFSAEGAIKGKETVFIEALKKIGGVINASSTYHKIVGRGYNHSGMEWAGKEPQPEIFFDAFEVDYDFVETMGMQLSEGRTFSKKFGNDSSNIVLNETAVKRMGLKDPVGKTIRRFGKDVQIIGVVKDFHFESLHEPIKPAYLFLYGGNTIIASVETGKMQEAIRSMEELYTKFNPGFPFTYSLLDEAFQKQYESESRVSALSRYFAGLAIIISCLGLFGLAAFSAQKRRKEIGVRKVVGASVANITAMLSTDFLRLILISLIIAFPLSWWIMSTWLQNFAYRITINPYIFIIAGISIIMLTLFTVTFQSVKAAMTNPVKSLRSE